MPKHETPADLDLQALDLKGAANAGFWLDLKHPTTKRRLAMRIKLLGIDSDRYEQKTFELARRRQDELAVTDAPQPLTAEVIHDRNRELIAACVVAWEGIKRGGQAVEFTGEASAVELFKAYGWIYEQVNVAVVNRANFLPGSVSD